MFVFTALATARAVLQKSRHLFTMKRFLAIAMLLCATTAIFAQNGRRPDRWEREFNPETFAKMQTERLHRVVELDSIQYQAVFLINYADALTMQDSMMVWRERAEGGKPARPTEEQMKAQEKIRREREEARNEQLKQILTPEQFEKYVKYREESEKRMKERRKRGRERRGERGMRNN